MRERGLEPLQEISHYHLKVARLPIPPPPQSKQEQKYTYSNKSEQDFFSLKSTIYKTLLKKLCIKTFFEINFFLFLGEKFMRFLNFFSISIYF